MSRIKYKIPWKIAKASFQSYENLIDNASNVSPLLCNMKDKSYEEKSSRSRALYTHRDLSGSTHVPIGFWSGSS